MKRTIRKRIRTLYRRLKEARGYILVFFISITVLLLIQNSSQFFKKKPIEEEKESSYATASSLIIDFSKNTSKQEKQLSVDFTAKKSEKKELTLEFSNYDIVKEEKQQSQFDVKTLNMIVLFLVVIGLSYTLYALRKSGKQFIIEKIDE